MGLKILDLSSFLPEKIVSNDDLSKLMDTSDEWIRTRTGIEERYISSGKEDTSFLAVEASKKLNIDKDKIDLVLVASFTSDLMVPNIASIIQRDLGLKEDLMAFDFNMACTGFVGGLKLADSLLDSGRQAIVVGAEVISKTLDGDRTVAVLFGDGAGASLVEKNEDFSAYDIGNRGNFEALHSLGHTIDKDRDIYLRMDGKAVFRFATSIMVETIEKTLANYQYDYDQIDYYVCHQANKRIINHVRKKINQPEEKFYMNLQKFGNTSAASIPLVLNDMDKGGLLKPGTRVLIAGFGGGLSWASTIIEW